jgi:hypothetical protein
MPSVTSDSECPSAAAVTAALAGLLPSNDPTVAVASIVTQDDRQMVRLSSEGEPVGSRELPRQPDCQVRALDAALIIAAWLDAMPARTFEPAEATPAERQKPEPEPTTPTTDEDPATIWVGLGLLGMIDPVGTDLGLTAEFAVDHAVGPLGLAVATSAALARDVTVGQGTARWWRPALQAALRLPFTAGEWNLEASVGPLIGLVVLHGRGYDENSKDVVTSWGAGAGLRSQRTWERCRLWVELGGRLWPETQRIRSEVQDVKTTRTRDLPRWEMYLGLGFSLSPH